MTTLSSLVGVRSSGLGFGAEKTVVFFNAEARLPLFTRSLQPKHLDYNLTFESPHFALYLSVSVHSYEVFQYRLERLELFQLDQYNGIFRRLGS